MGSSDMLSRGANLGAGQSFQFFPLLVSLPIKVAQRHNALLSFWYSARHEIGF
jgi:hypothetical protein